MERIRDLGVVVDWEKGKIYRDSGVLSGILSSFGKLEELSQPHLRRKVVEHRIRRLYERARAEGKEDMVKRLPDGEEIRVSFRPDRVVVETPRYRSEVNADQLTLVDRESGREERKRADLKEIHGILKDLEELLGYGDLDSFADARMRQPAYDALWGLPMGLLGGLLLSELIHHAGTSGQVEPPDVDHPPDDPFSFDDFDMV